MTPEQEVRFWRRFWSESLRLYGDKRGTYHELATKAMDRLFDQCARLCDKDPTPPESETDFQRRLAAACDDKARRDWAKRRAPGRVVAAYLDRVQPLDARPMDRWDAIAEVADLFGFQSPMACYQFLKREDVKGLPSTWPEV